jgi:diphthamide biosynthesis enzyme Dph1/Dph2-like protein
MKVLYIESKYKNLELDLKEKEISKLPSKLILAYSIQYKDIAIKIQKLLEKNKIIVSELKQVLGCSTLSTTLPILLIGSGRFHALNLYLQSPQIFILNGNKIEQINKQEIKRLENKKRAALLNFLSADNVGILVTTKPGQENLNLAFKLKQKIEKKDKNAWIFIANNIDLSQFENFNIGSWVNTACSGLSNDNPKIINYANIMNII